MHAQYLQHMQTGPLGGQEILREDDDRMRRHNERVFKTMTEEELALERLEVDAVVRRLEENRMYTTREIEPRKAWGSSNPSEQAKRRFTGAPRGTVGRASRPRGAGDTMGTTARSMRSTARSVGSNYAPAQAALPQQRYAPAPAVPDFGAVTDNWATSKLARAAATRSAAPAGGKDEEYIRQLESKVAELTDTVTTLRKSQELPAGIAAGSAAGVSAGPSTASLPRELVDQVDTLKKRYRDNLGALKTVYSDKKTLEAEKAALQRRVEELESGRGRSGRPTSAAPPAAAPKATTSAKPAKVAIRQEKLARIRKLAARNAWDADGDGGEGKVESKSKGDAEQRATRRREQVQESKGVAAPAPRPKATAGAEIEFAMTLDEDEDEGGDQNAPPGFDDEDSLDGEDEALGSSILHGKGATGQALSRSYPRGSGGAAGAVRGESKAQAPPNSEWGLEPEDTEAFTRLTRAKYLDNGESKTGRDRKLGGTGRSVRSNASSGTVPRPFVSMEMRNDQGKMGIAERKRLAEEAKRKADEEAMLNSTFKANELNPKVMEAKYHRLLEEAEIRRKANVTKRKAELEAMKAAFSGVEQRTQKARERWLAKKKKLEEEKQRRELGVDHAEEMRARRRRNEQGLKLLRKTANVKEQQEAAERLRKERIKQRAARMLGKSKLPNRMALWEKKKQEEKRRKAKAAKKERMFQPRINTKVPDFAKEKEKWERSMANAKAKFQRTQPAAFSFDSEERKAAQAEKRRQLEEKLRQEELAKSTPIVARPVPESSRQTSERPMSKMTNAARKRLEHVQAMRRKREEEELQEKLAEAERQQKMKQATKELSVVIQSMEKARLKEPLKWQQKASHVIKAEKRSAQAQANPLASSSTSLKRGKQPKRRAARGKTRNFLFAQTAVQAAEEKTYHRALLKMEKAGGHDSSSSDDELT